MRLVVVGPVYPYRGGIAHYTTLLERTLRARGHTVSLYSFSRQYPHWLFPGRSDRDPSQLALQVECQYTLDSLNPFTWQMTARLIRAQQPDGVILQWWVPYFAPMWWALTRRLGQHARIVYICHNVLPHERRIWDRWLARLALGTGHGYVVASQDEKAQLLDLLPDRRVALIPHPLYDMFARQAIPKDAARQKLGLPDGAPVVLFFGLVREYKGLRYLLEAMPRIIRECPGVRLVIAGEFWQDRQSYTDHIQLLGIQQSLVTVDRYIPNEEVPLYFSAADVVVLPYTHITQSGVVPLAFGFGVPVITTRVGGLPQVVAEGETGLLVEPADSLALAQAIIRCFQMPGLLHQLRENIRTQANPEGWHRLSETIELFIAGRAHG